MKLIFATTNEDKIKEAKYALGIEIEGTPLEIEEIQSLDPEKVALQKAQDYYDQLKEPLFIEDVALTFHALGKLPGTYISDFVKNLQPEGLCELLRDKKDRSATALTTLVYMDSNGEPHIFTGEVKGYISTEPRGNNGFAFDFIFIPEDETRTFGEMTLEEKNKYSMRTRALKNMKAWLDTQK